MVEEFFNKVKLDVEKEKIFKKSKPLKSTDNYFSQTQQYLPYKNLMLGCPSRIKLTFDYAKGCYISDDEQYIFVNNILTLNGSEVYGPIKILLISDKIKSYCIYQKRNLIVNKKSKPAKIETNYKGKISTWITKNSITRFDGPAVEMELEKRFYVPDKYDYIIEEDGNTVKVFRYYIDNKVCYYGTFLTKVWKNSDSLWSFITNIFHITTYK